ncbi:MAG: DUF6768 family protein [Pirellulaceae bacterium]
MNKPDDALLSAVNWQDKQYAEPPLRTQIADTFRGRFRWLAWIATFYRIAFLVIAIFAATKFFRVDETRDLIAYATLFLLSCFGMAFIKMWYWSLLVKNSVIREIMRLERQVAKLDGDIKTAS